MRARNLWSQIAILVAVFAFYNVAVSRLARRAPAHLLIQQTRTAPAATDIVLGNSLLVYGFNAEVFQSLYPRRKLLNLSLGFSYPPEHYLILDSYLKHQDATALRGVTLYYGFFDLQLSEAAPTGVADLTGNRNLLYFTDLKQGLDFYAPQQPLKAWQLRVVSSVPVAVERTQVWKQAELVRRKLEELGEPPQPTNEFGRVKDFAGLEAADSADFARRCQNAAQPETPIFNPATQKLMELARARGLKVVMVKMPMPSRHRRIYYQTPQWRAYEKRLRAATQAAGARYVDASNVVPDEGFSDPLHMGAPGRPIFTRYLLKTLDSKLLANST